MYNALSRALKSQRGIKMPEKKIPDQYAIQLYESIISQQLSVKASDTIWKRFVGLVESPSDSGHVLRHSVEDFRAIGLSRQKSGYILNIAELTENGVVDLDHLDELSDDEVIDKLTLIKGVGRWTAEMFLIFTLGRPDIFSSGDLGLCNAVKKLYGRAEITKKEIEELSVAWSPYRSLASITLWHSLDNN